MLEVTTWFWVIMRLVAGFCVAAISAAVEGWLNEAGMARNRARTFSIYVLVALSAVALGQVLFGLLPAEFRFRMAALIMMSSFIPLGLLANEPENTRVAPQFHLVMLRQIPLLAGAGMFLVGIVSGCIWTMTPLFAESRGLDGPAIGYTMTAVIAGSVILQWPIGIATDRLGSRFVMLLCAAVNLTVCGMFIFGQVATLMSVLYLLVGLFGGTSLTLYAVCATEAQASSPLGRVQIAALMLLLYGFGAALGPLASGLLQSADSMFYVSALSMFILLLLASLPPMRASVSTKIVILKLPRPHRQDIRPQRLERKAAWLSGTSPVPPCPWSPASWTTPRPSKP